MIRPTLNKAISIDDFRGFYWLKTELVSFCRSNGLSSAGGKIEITARIEHYLATGKVVPTSLKQVAKSNFDWKDANLNLNTKITDNYKNTENVRAFMTLHIGSHFKFNSVFMNWAKANVGKSLSEAIEEWNRIYFLQKNKEYKSEIAPQFEYNRFIRDFMRENKGNSLAEFMNWAKANVGKSLSEAIEEWNRNYFLQKSKEYKSEIAPQFEYNRFIRDFMRENKGKSFADAIKQWKQVRDKNCSKKLY